MLRKEVNELLTQTGPGTAMGDLFRRYWIPALLAMIFVLGFMLAVPLFVFLFLRLHGRLSWVLSIVLAVSAVLYVEIIFRRLLDYTLYAGLLG